MHEYTPADGDVFMLSDILDALDEGLLVIGPDNRVTCVNRQLRHLFGLNRDVPGGADTDCFVRLTLVSRICEEAGRAEIVAFLAGRSRAADIRCSLRLPDGGEERVRCSCRAMHEGPFSGNRLIRFSPELPDLGAGSVPGTRALPGNSHGGKMDAAKQRRIEEVLQESEDRYRFLVENLNEGIALIDREGIIAFANQRMADLLGCPVARIVGAPVYAFVDEKGADGVKEYLQRLDRSTREVFEFELIRKDDARIHTLVATTPIIDAGGTSRGFLAGVQDITSLKRTEAQLRESEEKYRSLVEFSAEATLIHRDREIVAINPAGMRLLGVSRLEEVVGKTILDIVLRNARETIEAFTVWDPQEGEMPLVELLVVRLDGTTVPVEGRGTRITFEGQPAIQVVMRDISHRKQAEEQLQARNRHLLLLNRIIGTSASTHRPGELLETALDQTLDLLGYDGGAIYRLDTGPGETALQCRRNIPDACLELAESILGISSSDILATDLPYYLEQDLGPGTSNPPLLRELGFAALACIPLIIESDVAGALLIGRREQGFFSHDERALLEAVGREIGASIVRGMLYQKLEAANWEANLYLDILTHDIRNADNVANIYADLLIDELEGEPARHARKLKDGIKKSIEITANVATLRKIQESRDGLACQNLHDVVLEEIAHFPDLRIQYDGQPVEVLADDLLPEIFTNLIGNAAKYGGPGVEVTVAIDEPDEETVVVTVADTGTGIPDDAKEAIFFRFERESSRRGSQGLGLSICRMLTARYGGRIWVEDRVPGHPEEGAAFRFTLRKAWRGGEA